MVMLCAVCTIEFKTAQMNMCAHVLLNALIFASASLLYWREKRTQQTEWSLKQFITNREKEEKKKEFVEIRCDNLRTERDRKKDKEYGSAFTGILRL